MALGTAANGRPASPLRAMLSRRWLDLLLLTGATASTRFLFRSHYLYDLDSVNFALAIERFDPRVHQPHPPGYFLYICLGRLLNGLLHNANLALVVLSIAASCGVAVMIYLMTLDWFGPRAARFGGLLFLFSPLAWFHGTVALTYSVEALFSALLGYLCWLVACGSRAVILPASILLGVAAGVRPSSLLFLGPLFLFSLRNTTLKHRFIGLAALSLTLLAWFLPMIYASGGFGVYFGALLSLWQAVPAKDTVFSSSPATSIARACTIVFIYMLCFGAASLAPLGMRYSAALVHRQQKVFTFVWIVPALCFFTFIFLKFVNSGYLLLLSPPACLWLGLWAAEWYENSPWRKPWKHAVMVVCGIVNVSIYLASPFYCSYRSMRHFEVELESVRTALPQVANAADTLILGFDSHFLGYRHAGYYLPGYLTMEYPAVKLREGTRIFAMQESDTHLLSRLPVGSYSSFILFPLPNSDATYQAYARKVESTLPNQGLHTIRLKDHDFVTGPISDLPLLFPAMVQTQ